MEQTRTDQLGNVRTVHDVLGITVTESSPQRVVLSLTVTPAVHQPFGVLHGGVSALLAEGAASLGGRLNLPAGKIVVGTELNCSHLRPVASGVVQAIATPIRIGRSVHVWAIELFDDQSRMFCVARCSLQVVDAPTKTTPTA